MNLTICLKALKEQLNDYEFESLGVLETSEKLRFFWKPKKVKLMLLAESHVYTTEEENNVIQNVEQFKDIFDYENYPKEFVKLIYCLGYGENEILETPLDKNSGTPQFWKIFYNTLNEIQNSDFSPILMGTTKNYKERISNKIKLLNEMKENGIWLIDASILALYGNGPKPKDYKKILEICWHNYINQLILKENPEAILVIGSQVHSNLKEHLITTGIPFDFVPQPQARLSKEEIQGVYKKTFEFAKKCIGKKISLPETEVTLHNNQSSENIEIKPEIKSKKTKAEKPVKISVSTNTDRIKYKFNEHIYGTARLVLAVVKKLIQDNPGITYQELEQKFPKRLQGSLGVIIKLDKIKDNKRFFISTDDVITLSDGIKIAVCSQWDKNNIREFINKVKELGYHVE